MTTRTWRTIALAGIGEWVKGDETHRCATCNSLGSDHRGVLTRHCFSQKSNRGEWRYEWDTNLYCSAACFEAGR